MSYIAYGVDFGTTNSAIGALSKDGKPIVVPPEGGQEKMMPSALYFPNDEKTIIVGQRAINEYLEFRDGRFIQSVKAVLPSRTFTSTWIRFDSYDAAELVALILERLKFIGDRFTGMDIRRVVLGRPVSFSDDYLSERTAEKRLLEAAELAGFEEVEFLLEPIAAAIDYEMTISQQKLVLVADFGGGTSDFTLIELGPDKINKQDRSEDIITTRGLPVAGDVFDANLMREKVKSLFGAYAKVESMPGKWLAIPASIFSDLCNKGRIIQLYREGVRDQLESYLRATTDPEGIGRLIKLIDHNLGFSLFSAIEDAKKDLSTRDSTSIHFNEKGIDVDAEVTIAEFEDLIAAEVERLGNCVDSLLKDAGVASGRIDTVYMTGGTSLVPAVRQMLAKKFGADKIVLSQETFLSVVTGLTLSARHLFD